MPALFSPVTQVSGSQLHSGKSHATFTVEMSSCTGSICCRSACIRYSAVLLLTSGGPQSRSLLRRNVGHRVTLAGVSRLGRCGSVGSQLGFCLSRWVKLPQSQGKGHPAIAIIFLLDPASAAALPVPSPAWPPKGAGPPRAQQQAHLSFFLIIAEH